MSRAGHGRALAALAFAATLAPLTLAQLNVPEPLPLDQVDLLQFDALDVVALAKEDEARDAAGGAPYRFAVPRDVHVTPDDMGTWEVQFDGSLLWRLRVGGRDAHSLNLGFSEFELPEGASLTIRASDGSHSIRPFTAADNAPHGELWTPVLLEEEVLVELRLRPEQLGDYRLTLMRVGQGYRGFGTPTVYESSYLSGSCNVDVVCPEGDGWELEINSVGAYTLNGFDQCSGVLVNDTSDSLTPYFLTANHCSVTPGSGASVVIYWNYNNTVCRPPFSAASGGPGDGPKTEFSSGVIHRASYGPSDFTLAEVEDPIDPAWDLGYSGWTRADSTQSSVVAIHHPGVEEKRISFEFDPTSITSYLEAAGPGDSTHIRVEDWDIGTTEGGSSGSPIYDDNHRVVGQLHGGFASCTSQTADWYGRIAVSWEGGGTPSTRLRDWLDPLNTGVTAVDSISLNTLCDDAGTAEFLSASVACEGSASVRVVDCGLDLDDLAIDTAVVTISSTSEPGGESVLLTETSLGSGRFEGSITTSQADGVGVLQVNGGDVLTLSYTDADDGMGGSNVLVTANASVDCAAPSVLAVTTSGVTAVVASVDVTANESVTGVMHYGTACGALNETATTSDEGSALSFGIEGLQDETTYFFSVTITDEAGNSTVDDNGGACYSFTTLPAKEYFTEEFLSDADLDGMTLTFTPDAGPDGYTGCVEANAGLPVNPAGSTALVLTDDDSQQVFLTGGNTVSLYGVSYGSVWVGSNGYVTFGQSDSDYDESLSEHFAIPRVAALYDDFNPSTGGNVGHLQTSESLVITWFGIEQFSTGDSNTFQVELFFDGRISISWAGVNSTDGIVGLSDGSGLQGDYLEENLSGIADCNTPVTCQTDLGFGGPGSAVLSMCGGDLSTGTTADLDLVGAASNATAFLFIGLSNNPSPVKGGTLVPVPVLAQVALTTNGAGEILIPGVAGGGGPVTIYAQYAIVDGAQTLGFAFSNALQIDYLP